MVLNYQSEDHAVNQIFEVVREKTNLVNDAVKCHHHSTATDNVVCHGTKWSFSPPPLGALTKKIEFQE